MKRLILTFVLLFSCKIVIECETIEKYNLKMVNWDSMYKAICMVESENNPRAFNKSANAAGIIQIIPIYLNDANRIKGERKYFLTDRFNVKKSREMFEIVQSYYNPERNITKAILIHYNGYSNYSRNPEANIWYLKRVFNKIKNIKT